MKFDNFMTNERNLAKELADKYSPDDPTFAKDLLGILINAAYGDEIDFDALFGKDGASEITKAFGLGDEPVTVTKTTTSVGGLPGDMGATPEEATAIADNILGETSKPLESQSDERTDFANALVSATSDDEVRELCAKYGIQLSPGDSIQAPEDSDPASDANLDKLDGKNPEDKGKAPKDFGDTPEKKDLAKQAADNAKPKEEKKPEEKKPEPPKEEKKPETPKEDKKDEPDDTMRNITSALAGRP